MNRNHEVCDGEEWRTAVRELHHPVGAGRRRSRRRRPGSRPGLRRDHRRVPRTASAPHGGRDRSRTGRPARAAHGRHERHGDRRRRHRARIRGRSLQRCDVLLDAAPRAVGGTAGPVVRRGGARRPTGRTVRCLRQPAIRRPLGVPRRRHLRAPRSRSRARPPRARVSRTSTFASTSSVGPRALARSNALSRKGAQPRLAMYFA